MRWEWRERFPRHRLQRKPLVSDPGMQTARALRTCCDACRARQPVVAGKTFPAFPAHAHPSILCIWQEAHGVRCDLEYIPRNVHNTQGVWSLFCCFSVHVLFQYKSIFSGTGIPIIKIRRPWDRLIFKMIIPLHVSYHLFSRQSDCIKLNNIGKSITSIS